MDRRPTWTDCDEAGDYVVPNVLSPRDLVFRPDNMDETVPHEADKTLTDGGFSYQHYYSRFDQPKNYPAKNKKNIIGRKRGPAKTIFSQRRRPRSRKSKIRKWKKINDSVLIDHVDYLITLFTTISLK